jgi:SpoVK/Ycf46/Vps4 family AAA+-type ATPase
VSTSPPTAALQPATLGSGEERARPSLWALELERLRRRLELTNLRIARLYVLGKGQRAAAPPEADRTVLDDLYVSDTEFQQHLSALSGLAPRGLDHADTAQALESIDRAAAALARKLQAEDLRDARRGQHSRFDRLSQRAGLSPLDREILLLVLAPEIDRRYRRVFAYLHDDWARGLPSVGLIIDVLAPLVGDGDRLEILGRFEADSPLVRRGIVELLAARSDDVRPLSQRHARAGDATVGALLGVPRVSEGLLGRVRHIAAAPAPPAHLLPPSFAHDVNIVAERVARAERGVSVFFTGPEPAANRAAAGALSRILGLPVLELELAPFLAAADRALDDMATVLRDAFVLDAAIVVLGLPDTDQSEPAALRNLESIWRRLQDFPGLLLVPATSPPPASWLAEGRHAVTLTVRLPDFAERVQVFQAVVRADPVGEGLTDGDLESVANRYRMSRQQIAQSVAWARDAAWARTPPGGRPSMGLSDLIQGARAQFSRDIGSLARRIEPRAEFEDLVLPPREKAHITELAAFVERRGQVYEAWGFESKFPRGTGAKALFFGRSGTGKTMAAECIARRLGLDLFKVDLSAVVSKWVGETEKNLSAIFDRAQEAQAVLLFDEADALFGNRTSTQSAVDRYANLETNYLLQRIEEYDGIAILSSNLKQNIDEAFTRRFHFVVEFPLPDRPAREEIWRRAFPRHAPLAQDVDFPFLADRFKFTGGNIKNSVLRAAFLAASHGNVIALGHILHGVFREYQNLEREPTERDFAPHWHHVSALVDLDKGLRKKEGTR